MNVGETVDAKKIRYGRAEALRLAKSAATVIVSKGKSVIVFDMKKPPGDEELAKALLGPTGNLRAPTMRIGKMLLVGFNEESSRIITG